MYNMLKDVINNVDHLRKSNFSEPYDSFFSQLLEAQIPLDRITRAYKDGTLDKVFEKMAKTSYQKLCLIRNRYNYKTKSTKKYDIGLIGAGDFAMALAKSFKIEKDVAIYDINELKTMFSNITRISTNRNFSLYISGNVNFVQDFEEVLNSKFLIIAVPSNSIPAVMKQIKTVLPNSYKNKQYVLVSKGFVGRGYLPHRWLQKEGVPFENIIWASGGNVAKDIIQKQSQKIAVVSKLNNVKSRKAFVKMFNTKYLKPVEYSGFLLLASELGGILKNYYAGLGRYILDMYGEKSFQVYKEKVRKEFRRAIRIFSKAPTISIRAYMIRKASHGPAFWEDLDVTSRAGRNGYFGKIVFDKGSVQGALSRTGLVESFNTISSTLSLFNKINPRLLKRVPILNLIMEIYEDLHIEYLSNGDAFISEDHLNKLSQLERKFI
jgi:glycerol-3-phosphate dehydrogenase